MNKKNGFLMLLALFWAGAGMAQISVNKVVDVRDSMRLGSYSSIWIKGFTNDTSDRMAQYYIPTEFGYKTWVKNYVKNHVVPPVPAGIDTVYQNGLNLEYTKLGETYELPDVFKNLGNSNIILEDFRTIDLYGNDLTIVTDGNTNTFAQFAPYLIHMQAGDDLGVGRSAFRLYTNEGTFEFVGSGKTNGFKADVLGTHATVTVNAAPVGFHISNTGEASLDVVNTDTTVAFLVGRTTAGKLVKIAKSAVGGSGQVVGSYIDNKSDLTSTTAQTGNIHITGGVQSGSNSFMTKLVIGTYTAATVGSNSGSHTLYNTGSTYLNNTLTVAGATTVLDALTVTPGSNKNFTVTMDNGTLNFNRSFSAANKSSSLFSVTLGAYSTAIHFGWIDKPSGSNETNALGTNFNGTLIGTIYGSSASTTLQGAATNYNYAWAAEHSTSATNPNGLVLVDRVGGTGVFRPRLKFLKDGGIYIGTSTDPVYFGNTIILGSLTADPAGSVGMEYYNSNTNAYRDYLGGAGGGWKSRAYVGGNDFINNQFTAGQSANFWLDGVAKIAGTFTSVVNTVSYRALEISPTINQSSGVSGSAINVGIYYNPTVTSSSNKHFSFYATSGQLYVNDYATLASRVYIGTSLTAQNKLLNIGGDVLIKGEVIFWNSSNSDIMRINSSGVNIATSYILTTSTVRSYDISGVDQNGTDLTLVGGRPTGTARSGSIIFVVTPLNTYTQSSPANISGAEKMRLNGDGQLILQNLKTGVTAPVTTGTTRMVITDANGQLSFAAIPTGGTGSADGNNYTTGVSAVNGTITITRSELTDVVGTASGTWGISVTGNAATVTNGLYTTGSYANPAWLTSLAAAKVTGLATVATSGSYADLTNKPTSFTLTGDVEITDSTKGIILTAADGTRARITLVKIDGQITLQISDPL